MRLYGLTGGIGCGKSTVGRMFAELGACVVDADVVARDLVRLGEPAWQEIYDAFTHAVFDDEGNVDRKKLGALVFANAEARAKLEAILHPKIAAEVRHRAVEAHIVRGQGVAFYEAALLVETGAYKELAGLVVVACAPQVQFARVVARDLFDGEEAWRRIHAQMPLAEKLKAADWVVWNDGDQAALRVRVAEVWEQVR